jgi:alpha-L-rhamnosidase
MEVYEPRFFYTGFRYIEVTTSDNKNPEHLKVEGRVVRSANERNGTFESSDLLLNQIHRAGVWSQMGNMQSYPTDCPHREKGAYNGDGQVIAEASMHDFHMAPFYTKWINDMRDSQEENGRIPNTSPVLVGGMGGGVAWGSAYILIPWWMHHYYGDTRILEEHYPVMKEYLQYLKNLGSKDEDPSEPFIIDNFDGYWYSLGEWCAPGQSDCPNHPVVNTFYYYYNSLLLSKIAEELGYTTDAQSFRALSDTIKQNFNRKFFNSETALYGTDETYQTYQLLALIGDVVPEGYREKVFQTIVDDIKMRDDHLNTGIIGTKYLWPVLVEGGENELAYRVATKTTWPSFGYWIENNSTTLLKNGRAKTPITTRCLALSPNIFISFWLVFSRLWKAKPPKVTGKSTSNRMFRKILIL